MGYTRSFTIYDSADSERMMKDVIKEMGLDEKSFPARVVLNAISREKDNLATPADVLAGSAAGMKVILIPDCVPANEQTTALSWKILDSISRLPEALG